MTTPEFAESRRAREIRAQRGPGPGLMDALPGLAYQCRFDEDWTMDFVSAGAHGLTGYPPEEFLPGGSITFAGIIHPDDRERVVRSVREALDEHRPFRLEYRIIRADGEERWVQEVGHSVEDEEGGLLALEGVVLDITEQRHLEAQFQQAQKMEAVGRLAGALAHDFNNLLTVIGANAQFLMEDLEGLEQVKDHVRAEVREVARAAERAAELTTQLLSFARARPHRLHPLDLREVVSDVEGLMARLLGEAVTLNVHLPPRLPLARVDRGQMEQVLMNLAANARDALPQGGSVTVEALLLRLDQPYASEKVNLEAGRWVLLTVSDDGAGIEPETLDRIFEPFYTTKESGTGLGLSTVFGIVHRHGGQISVYSEPGRGTTFKIHLPALDADDPEDDIAPEASLTDLRGTETILLVEDDSVVHQMGTVILEQFGYRVLAARDKASALEILDGPRGKEIDLAVLDLVLAGESGLKLAQEAAGLRPGIRVLLSSGYARSSLVDQGVLDRATPFIEKPFTPRTLLVQVREVLDGPEPEPPESPDTR